MNKPVRNMLSGEKRNNINAATAFGGSKDKCIIKARGIVKSYFLGGREIKALQDVNLEMKAGEFVAVVGPSGAGKSTMLHILGTLEKPSEGVVEIGGKDISRLNEQARNNLRCSDIGFVFQFHHLLPGFTALENVMMPALILGKKKEEVIESAQSLLISLGLANRFNNKPAELSGGEQQRVAVARALVNNPSLILADEPSGNLDRRTGRLLENDLIEFTKKRDAAIIVVTHNEEWAGKADRVLSLVDGRIKESNHIV